MPQLKRESAATSRRQVRIKCRECNHLDPQGHSLSSYGDKPRSKSSSSQPKQDVRLSLSIDTLRLSRLREDDCRFCRVLARALDAIASDWRKTRPPISIDLAYGRPIRLILGTSAQKPKVFELYAKIGCKPPWPSLGYGVTLPQHSGSDETFNFASRCLKECISSPKHGLCRSQETSFRPTRLLQIIEPGTTVKLVEKSFHSSTVEYIALSHCWGEKLPITTTKETERNRIHGIQWAELPPLFQDTLIIAHRLGLEFVWIDALCILQNDKKDWEREASAMSQVYANAYVTIAAVLAVDSNQQCLETRKAPARIKYQNTKGDEYVIKVREVSDHRPTVSTNKPADIDGPLVSRAWALQEHVLCSRVLHYTSSEVVFECRSMYACECTPNFKYTSITTPALLPKILGAKSGRSSFETWHRLVEKYTLRNLTHSSDKLPAISGMAFKIQEMVKSKYLAGLWEANILEDLLWSSSLDLERPHLTAIVSEYRAPSFSWASVDTQICYEEHDQELSGAHSRYMSNYISGGCSTSEDYPLGQVDSGHIKLCGPVLNGYLIGPDKLEFHYKLKLSGPAVIDVFPDTLLILDGDSHTSPDKIRRARLGETYKPFKGMVYCLGIKDDTREGIVSGLVLSQAGNSTSDQTTYQRLGVFHCGRNIFTQAPKNKVIIQ